MAKAKTKEVEPAQKSYFFSKGYIDLKNTIADAWKRNGRSIEKYKYQMGAVKYDKALKKWGLRIIYLMAMLSVVVFGTLITVLLTVLHVLVLLLFMLFVYIGFSVFWCIDRIYLVKNKIFTACHVCKEKSLIPIYVCSCGEKHKKLTPGVYGILHRTCLCGTKLPTTFFNGRKNLKAICPKCGEPLSDRESRPLCVPIIGGRSVGKTAYITAFSKKFIDEVAPSLGMTTEFYNTEKAQIYTEIENDYALGDTRMTQRANGSRGIGSVSFSFFVQHPTFKPERLIHVYDVAGEVFTNNDESEVQKQYEYCHGMILMFDPFSVVEIADKYESVMTPNDIAGIGRADITYILDSFFSKLRMVTGLKEAEMMKTPIALVIGKIDTGDLMDLVGDTAVHQQMAKDPAKFQDYYDTMDYLCRKFLIDNGLDHFLAEIDNRFKNNRYFSCSAIGHTKGAGPYEPVGVLAPMQWIAQRTDDKMAKLWNNVTFSKTPAYASYVNNQPNS